MESLRVKLTSAVLGASGGMAGLLSLSKCSGSACTSCFGCAGAGLGVLLLVLLGRLKGDSAVGRTVMRFVSSPDGIRDEEKQEGE